MSKLVQSASVKSALVRKAVGLMQLFMEIQQMLIVGQRAMITTVQVIWEHLQICVLALMAVALLVVHKIVPAITLMQVWHHCFQSAKPHVSPILELKAPVIRTAEFASWVSAVGLKQNMAEPRILHVKTAVILFVAHSFRRIRSSATVPLAYVHHSVQVTALVI